MAGTCFVIQPFGGKFDKRFEDVYKKAIISAGLDPYRVDRDPSASIPIQTIEKEISNASVCLADITLDNPNVWFELGFAIASNKDLCLVCADERKDAFPFDVQHRNITKYITESIQDYDNLTKKITDRLMAIIDSQRSLAQLPAIAKATNDLNPMEVSCLGLIANSVSGIGFAVSNHFLSKEMEKLGYNSLATNTSIVTLLNKQFLIASVDEETDWNGESSAYECYKLTQQGWNWLADNLEKLNLKPKPPKKKPSIDEEIPF